MVPLIDFQARNVAGISNYFDIFGYLTHRSKKKNKVAVL